MVVESHHPCLWQEFIYEAYKPPQLYLSLNEPILDRWLSSLISTHQRKESHQLSGLLMLLSAGSPCLTFIILTWNCNLLSCQLILLLSALHSWTMEKSTDVHRKRHSLRQRKNRLCFSSSLSSQAYILRQGLFLPVLLCNSSTFSEFEFWVVPRRSPRTLDVPDQSNYLCDLEVILLWMWPLTAFALLYCC